MEIIKELTIKEEQNICLEILNFFSNICSKENIPFFLAYGTLLGAVREHGFIDWDDDVDIWMKREDINRFIKVFNSYSNDRFFLQTYETDPLCVSPEMIRICVDGTYKWPEGCEKESFHTGVFFDIFPLDFGFGTEQDKKDLIESTKVHIKIWETLRVKRSATLKGLIRSVYRFFLSRRKYIRRYRKLIDSHANCKSEVLLSFPASYAGTCRSFFKASHFESKEMVQFENLLMPIPADSDGLLRYMYGDDYMIPSKTKPHRTIAYLIK